MVNKQYSATDLEAFMKIAANWQNSSHNLLEAVDIKSEMQQYMNNPAMNMYKKRERTQNWNHQEKKFLLDLCRKDMRIIENKRLDAGLTAVKNKAWKIIHHKFSSQFGTDRTCNRLKEQWRRMKACTRNEILDYNNRLGRFGQEVADRKKPSPFTFEVWEFMQEAKKACKSEALDGIDYSKIPLALEEDYDYQEFKHETDENDCDDSSRTPPQDLCDVDIKEETNETFNDTYNNDSTINGERLSSSPSSHMARNGPHDLSERIAMHSPANSSIMDHTNSSFLSHGNDISGFHTSFNMNNISATLEALNALRTGQFPASAAAAAAVALQNNFAAAQQQQQQQQHQLQQQQEQSNVTHNSSNSNQHQINNNNNEDDDDVEHDAEPSAKRQRKLSTNEQNDAQQQQPQQHNTSSSTDDGHASLGGIHCNGINAINTVAAAAAAAAQSTSTAATPISSASSPPQSAELRAFMEMQSKEHFMRMKILDVQLQAAKFNRDLVEINKTLALQKLQEYASKRLAS